MRQALATACPIPGQGLVISRGLGQRRRSLAGTTASSLWFALRYPGDLTKHPAASRCSSKPSCNSENTATKSDERTLTNSRHRLRDSANFPATCASGARVEPFPHGSLDELDPRCAGHHRRAAGDCIEHELLFERCRSEFPNGWQRFRRRRRFLQRWRGGRQQHSMRYRVRPDADLCQRGLLVRSSAQGVRAGVREHRCRRRQLRRVRHGVPGSHAPLFELGMRRDLSDGAPAVRHGLRRCRLVPDRSAELRHVRQSLRRWLELRGRGLRLRGEPNQLRRRLRRPAE